MPLPHPTPPIPHPQRCTLFIVVLHPRAFVWVLSTHNIHRPSAACPVLRLTPQGKYAVNIAEEGGIIDRHSDGNTLLLRLIWYSLVLGRMGSTVEPSLIDIGPT